jgi:DNA adenine methylase
VGGKKQVLPAIRALVPRRFGTFFEPMVGSGAVFFGLAPERAVLADLNRELVSCFRVVRDRVEELVAALAQHENTYEHFIWMRGLDPDALDEVERAARTIYLNKTCFNGLYRVNRQGRFNVPYGNTAHVVVCDAVMLRRFSERLRAARLVEGDVEATVQDARAGDLVYLDPPYLRDPERDASRFHAYQPEAFGLEAHRRLAALARELEGRGCHVLVSNADNPAVRALYEGFVIRSVDVARQVNARTSNRKGWRELLISSPSLH